MTTRMRVAIFVAVIVICTAGVVLFLRSAPQRSVDAPSPTRKLTVQWIDAPVAKGPALFFSSTVGDHSFGRVAYVPLDAIDGPRYLAPISCVRLYVNAGVGSCLVTDFSEPLTPHRGYVFDPRFTLSAVMRLTGAPSRTRVSADGRLAAITVFESGHSYAEGGFSTRTTLIDTAKATEITDLEKFEVQRDGRAFKAVDFNFWGVTFTPDSRQFYATLATGGQILLVRGDIATKTATVIHEGIECPSLSPDGRHIAFKKRITGPFGLGWRVAVLELATMKEIELAREERSVDDQVDWLDDDHILYHNPGDDGSAIWVLRRDNSEAPRILLAGAYSPSVSR